MPNVTTFIQHNIGRPSHCNQTRKEIKEIHNVKEKIKLSLFVEHMVLYLENSKDNTRKLLELINEFSKISGYTINIQN